MSQNPVLVVMAAGMGSRYGGLKQIDPIGPSGEVIIDYSLYDARLAGFETVIFVIRKENEADFGETVLKRAAEAGLVTLTAFQELEDVPAGFSVPPERTKPWGTAHAVLAARRCIRGPFAVINADDFYGRSAFRLIFDFLSAPDPSEDGCSRYAMVGYRLRNTLTDFGTVSRGVCGTGRDGDLRELTERTAIERAGQDARFTEDGGRTWTPIPGNSTVSMNLWGLDESFLRESEKQFRIFLRERVPLDPLKAEFYLPGVVDGLLKRGEARVRVLRSEDRWFGVTYRQDKAFVQSSIRRMIEDGVYPADLLRGK